MNGSCLINMMAGKTTGFAQEAFERKRELLWKNKLPASRETRRKYCNMAHFGKWTEHICPECPSQKEPEFGQRFQKNFGQGKIGERGKGPRIEKFPGGSKKPNF